MSLNFVYIRNFNGYEKANAKRAAAGFTLIETLVAVSVLVLAIAAPLSLASQSLFASIYAKDQVTASYLAQEALEVVRYKRDYELMNILGSPTQLPRSDWLNWLEDKWDGDEASIAVDTKDLSISDCEDIDDSCALLKIDGDIYNHSSGDNSRFRRIVTIKKIPGNDDEISVQATVSWTTGKYSTRSFTIKENLYNWLPNYGD